MELAVLLEAREALHLDWEALHTAMEDLDLDLDIRLVEERSWGPTQMVLASHLMGQLLGKMHPLLQMLPLRMHLPQKMLPDRATLPAVDLQMRPREAVHQEMGHHQVHLGVAADLQGHLTTRLGVFLAVHSAMGHPVTGHLAMELEVLLVVADKAPDLGAHLVMAPPSADLHQEVAAAPLEVPPVVAMDKVPSLLVAVLVLVGQALAAAAVDKSPALLVAVLVLVGQALAAAVLDKAPALLVAVLVLVGQALAAAVLDKAPALLVAVLVLVGQALAAAVLDKAPPLLVAVLVLVGQPLAAAALDKVPAPLEALEPQDPQTMLEAL